MFGTTQDGHKSDAAPRKIFFVSSAARLDRQATGSIKSGFRDSGSPGGKHQRLRPSQLQKTKSAFIDAVRNDAVKRVGSHDDNSLEPVNFYDIVDTGSTALDQADFADKLIGGLLKSSAFQRFILLVVTINTVGIWIYTIPSFEEQYGSTIDQFDSICLTIFTLEILLKIRYHMWDFWKEPWNVFDFVLVAISIMGTVLHDASTRKSVGGRAIRFIRVARAFRTLRILEAHRNLQVVVSTFFKSLIDLVNILMLTMIVMFIFAVIGVQSFGQEIPEHFLDLSRAIYTLWILITQDGWILIWKDIEAVYDPEFPVFPAAYCMCFIVIGAWVFVNVISGVTVTNWQKTLREAKLAGNKKLHAGEIKSTLKAGVRHDTVPIDPSKGTDREYKPLNLATFRRLPPKLIANYILVLNAWDTNHKEFVELSKAVKDQLDVIRQTNLALKLPQPVEEEFNEEEYQAEPESADALTRLLKKPST